MATEYIRAKELARMWGVTTRRINQLCASNQIPGVRKEGIFWMIPDDAKKPEVLRDKSTKAADFREKTTTLLPCPVGITSYKEVSGECYYVDKTLLIKDILDDHSKVFLFTRPRRFGKTLTMDMIRTFFEKTDKDTSVFFTDKKIWSAGNAYRSFQGRYPVVFLSFKDAHQKNWEEMYKSLCFSLKEEFRKHVDLLFSDKLDEFDKQYYRRIMEGTADSTEYQYSLGKLAGMLSLYYGEKAIIIVDEYDTPIQQGYLGGYYNEVIDFMRNLFSAGLKDNENLEFGILTGILRIAKESLFSGLNNLVVNTILDSRYSEYFGFTAEEVSEMAGYYGLKDKLPVIRDWYDGYLFGNSEIYNPWSVISYFNNKGIPKAFWSRTSGNEIIGELIRNADAGIQESLTRLIQGDHVEAMIDTDIIYPEIGGDPDIIYSFLLVAGYLRVTGKVGELGDNPICTLEIPNREIRSVFQKEILTSYPSLFPGSVLRSFEAALRTGDAALLTDSLQNYLMQSASFFDTAHENFYHGMVLGMLAIMSDHYYITSNREAGEGRFDIQMEPRDRKQPGFIIEFKAGENLSTEELEKEAKEALAQIRDRKYIEDLKRHGIRSIGMFGIAFSGKHAASSYEQINISRQVPKMVKIYNTENVAEAEEIVTLLKGNGIPAYHQNASTGATAHSMSGFGLYGVDVFVDEADAEKAKKLLSE